MRKLSFALVLLVVAMTSKINAQELPFKDLRSLIDSGKKELSNGVVVVYAIKDNKIGLAVGVTQELSDSESVSEVPCCTRSLR